MAADTITSLLPWSVLAPLLGISYLSLCHALRYRQRDKTLARYPYRSREDLAKMTNQHAFEIQKGLYATEFPFTMEKALQFALFRTYGIPTISQLLVDTRQLSRMENAGKRYADTVALIAEFMVNPPDSERCNSAIARMNWLHGEFQKPSNGRISNDDMLYTLSLFALEPVRWTTRYEWRALTDLEICAIGTFWKSLGDAMAISYADLVPSSGSSKPVFESGLDWFHAIEAWSDAYEARTMVPHPANKRTADVTTNILLYDVPSSARPFGRKVVSALMDPRLRAAMLFESPPAWLATAVTGSLRLRRLVLRYAALPRPWVLRNRKVSDDVGAGGRVQLCEYQAEPYYVAPTLWNRWGPLAWVKRISGLPVPGDKPGEYKPGGFLTGEVGPKGKERAGKKEHEKGMDVLMGQGRGGCPFF